MISFIVLGITLGMIFLTPIELFLPTVMYMYSVLILWEWSCLEVKTIDLVIFLVYSAMGTALYLLGLQNLIPYTGVFFYCSLGILFIAGALVNRPITLPRGADAGRRLEHRILNYMLGSGYILSLCISLCMFPKPAYIWLPLVITAVSLLVCIPLARVCARYFESVKNSQVIRKL